MKKMKWILGLLLIAVLVLTAIMALGDDSDCPITVSTGWTYDGSSQPLFSANEGASYAGWRISVGFKETESGPETIILNETYVPDVGPFVPFVPPFKVYPIVYVFLVHCAVNVKAAGSTLAAFTWAPAAITVLLSDLFQPLNVYPVADSALAALVAVVYFIVTFPGAVPCPPLLYFRVAVFSDHCAVKVRAVGFTFAAFTCAPAAITAPVSDLFQPVKL